MDINYNLNGMEERVRLFLDELNSSIGFNQLIERQNPNQQPSTSPYPLLKLIAASEYIPKTDSKNPRGDDANLVCEEYNCIGVADGVGGHWKKGIDPGEYARELMENSFLSICTQLKGLVNPIRVLCEAYSNTRSKGSSTACIITLNGNVLRAANVGDSGFMVIRDGKVIYKSEIQIRRFNCPYQLGNDNDNPSEAQDIALDVEKGDIIVAGTDGLFDNLTADQILEQIMSENIVTSDINNIQDLARSKACKIADLAWRTSLDISADTPFSREAEKAGHGRRSSGGKEDDITVIVAYVD